MKTDFLSPFIALLITVSFLACTPEQNIEPAKELQSRSAAFFDYGSEVFYLGDHNPQLLPATSPSLEGEFKATPDLLAIDPHTGSIDLTKSETGLTYRISFTAKNGQVFERNLTVAGMDYQTSAIDFSKSVYWKPTYIGEEGAAMPEAQFTQLKDVASGINYAAALDEYTGAVNMKKLIKIAGLKAGEGRIFEVKYQLGDKSDYAQNSIRINVYYSPDLHEAPYEYQLATGLIEGAARESDEAAFEEINKQRPPLGMGGE
ncbi:hypothetical protein AAG747_05265 [Rapidithrix thailandica]|uniref:Lipoprotein n=1 Tax=Rapidithrix thailandica TaxID=413964 RepID=A0AAW9S2M1_9BACT